MGKQELSDDFELCPILEKHICCTNIDNYGKVEYLRAKDVSSCFNLYKHKQSRLE